VIRWDCGYYVELKLFYVFDMMRERECVVGGYDDKDWRNGDGVRKCD